MDSIPENEYCDFERESITKRSKLIKFEETESQISDDILNYEHERSTEFESPRSRKMNIQEPYENKHTVTLDLKRTVTFDFASACDS